MSDKEVKVKGYDVPDLSLLEKADVLLETIEKQAHGITDSLGKVNEKLLPSIEKEQPIEEETQPDQAKPSGWLEKKVRHLEHIQNLLCRVNQAASRLRETVADRAVKGG